MKLNPKVHHNVSSTTANQAPDVLPRKSGAAPNATVVSLKVLDSNGTGTVSNIIQALGWVLANHTAFISPAIMHWTRSGDLIVMAVLGGMGSVIGPVIGAVAFLVLEEGLSRVTEYWPIILGPMILLVVLYARGGIDGFLTGMRRG